ncbi:MAG: hypothetical protein NT004_13065 [Bacteroidetes bacterium]|nr:hypothetical protein [Bacteroidota bacterium]
MKRIVLTALIVVVIAFAAFSQAIICYSIFFDTGKSKISLEATKILLTITEKIKKINLFEITLTAYIEKPDKQKPQQSLTMKRFQEVCKYLINQNMGLHIRDIEIVDIAETANSSRIVRLKNRIDVTIREKFPNPAINDTDTKEVTALTIESDTVITAASGTQVKIEGGSFFPSKISDYNIEIKELLTTDDLINNNISTTTSDRRVIKTASAIRIMAIPRNSSSLVPVKLQKPVIILIPVADTLTSEGLTLFYQAKDNKSFITWKKTRDSITLKQYDGNTFYMIKVCQLGWVVVGTLLNSCNCRIITPKFQEQGLIIVYPDWGSVVFFDNNNRENMINIPCAEGERGFKISIQASDHTGQMFSLEKTFLTPGINKESIGIYKIRKSDYVRF